MEKDYKNLYDSMCHAVTMLEKENYRLKEKVLVLENKEKQWQIEKMQQQQIIQQSLDASNTVSNRYLQEINELKAEIRQLQA